MHTDKHSSKIQTETWQCAASHGAEMEPQRGNGYIHRTVEPHHGWVGGVQYQQTKKNLCGGAAGMQHTHTHIHSANRAKP